MAPAQSTLHPTRPHPFNYGEGSSSSDLVVQPFNLETRLAFGLMLEGSRNSSREHVSLAERQQMIDWVTETVQQRGLVEKDAKRRSLRLIFSIRTASYAEILTKLTKLEKS